jgi:hypothetical protein
MGSFFCQTPLTRVAQGINLHTGLIPKRRCIPIHLNVESHEMERTAGPYERTRLILYQLSPRHRQELQRLEYWVQRLAQATGEQFDDDIQGLLDSYFLRPHGDPETTDQYVLTLEPGRDCVGLWLWCNRETRQVRPLDFVDAKLRLFVTTIHDSTAPQANQAPKEDCQGERVRREYQQPERDIYRGRQAENLASGRRYGRGDTHLVAAIPCTHTDDCFWT